MNTQNTSTPQPQPPRILAGIDPTMNVQRPLPLAAVLRAMEPLVQKNDPARSAAFPLFSTWLLERDVPMSLSLGAQFWETFLHQFNLEIARRVQQWAQSINTPGLRSPLSLLLFEAKIIDQWYIPGLKARMCRTPLGKAGFAGLSAATLVLGASVVIPITLFAASIGLRVGAHVFAALRHAPALLGF